VIDMMVRMRRESGMNESTVTPEIHSMLIFDRFVFERWHLEPHSTSLARTPD